MRAVSSGYGGTDNVNEVAVDVVDQLVPSSEVPEPEEVAVEAEVTRKRSSKAKAALASMLGALGIGATSILGL